MVHSFELNEEQLVDANHGQEEECVHWEWETRVGRWTRLAEGIRNSVQGPGELYHTLLVKASRRLSYTDSENWTGEATKVRSRPGQSANHSSREQGNLKTISIIISPRQPKAFAPNSPEATVNSVNGT